MGIAVAAGCIIAEVLIVILLKRLPENAFSAVFIFGVLVVSAGWGFGLSIATSVASCAAYAYFHVVESRESLVPAVVVFSILALLTNVLVGQSRLRAVESDQRRREADLLAALARTLLREANSPEVLEAASNRLSQVLELPPPYAVLRRPMRQWARTSNESYWGRWFEVWVTAGAGGAVDLGQTPGPPYRAVSGSPARRRQ